MSNIETDFTFEDSDERINKENTTKLETAECGGCGIEIPIDAKSCHICGAKFE